MIVVQEIRRARLRRSRERTNALCGNAERGVSTVPPGRPTDRLANAAFLKTGVAPAEVIGRTVESQREGGERLADECDRVQPGRVSVRYATPKGTAGVLEPLSIARSRIRRGAPTSSGG